MKKKNRFYKFIIFIFIAFVNLNFDNPNPILKKVNGVYRVEAYPKPDGLNWEVKLKKNGKGYQKSFFEGCSQSELKFKWKLSHNEIVFCQHLTREKDACPEKWSEWNDECFNDTDPFTIEVLNENEFILTSKIEGFQELWIKTK